uniref:Uncharacterized protein LOC113795531 n=1 Tax=Dermatophagoides pteronyssinus TaxID=6956 RepID=A0A6P6Y967_DERPT
QQEKPEQISQKPDNNNNDDNQQQQQPLQDDKLPKQPEIIKRTALNEPESKPEPKQPKKEEKESTKSVMAISDDQTKIDPKSLSKFKDDLK